MERFWVSNYSPDDITGGTEILGKQFCGAMDLRYISANKIGSLGGSTWELSAELDKWLGRVGDIDVLVRNSMNGYTFVDKKPNIAKDIVVCCEHLEKEANAISSIMPALSEHKRVEFSRQMTCVSTADKVVAISDGERESFLNSGVPEDELVVIEPYVDLNIFTPAKKKDVYRGIPDNEKPKHTALFVGRKHDRKGWDIITELQERLPDIAIRTLTDGYLTPQAVAAEYQQADFLLMPSRYESFGFIFAEALATNLPIIGSRVGLFEDWQPTEHGIFPEEVSADSFEEAILSFEDKKFLESRTMAEKRFSKDRFKRECDELLSDWR